MDEPTSSKNHFKLRPFFENELKVEASITYTAPELIVDYYLHDPKSLVLMPEKIAGQSKRRDDLFKTTCFELFLKEKNSSKYTEFNFSPTGDWNIYQFSGYRERSNDLANSLNHIKPPKIDCKLPQVKVTLELNLDLPSLFDYEISLTAVLEDKCSNLSFWAINHKGPSPDFHLPESFCSLT
jgi:hypothetical protein